LRGPVDTDRDAAAQPIHLGGVDAVNCFGRAGEFGEAGKAETPHRDVAIVARFVEGRPLGEQIEDELRLRIQTAVVSGVSHTGSKAICSRL
jgi:hypothetical protein